MKKKTLFFYLFVFLFSLPAFAQESKFQPVDIYSPAYTYLISGNNISITGNANLTGNLFSNSSITLSGNPAITGDLSAVGTISGKGNSTITGTTQEEVASLSLPVLPDPSYFYNLADQVVMPTGTHKISGEINQIIYVGGDVKVDGNLSGVGTIVATGDIKIASATNTEGSEISFISYKDISLEGNLNLTALFSAAGSIKVSGNGKVSGSLMADSVKVSGNATLTYQPLLAEDLLTNMEEAFNQEEGWQDLCKCAQLLGEDYGQNVTDYLTPFFQNKEKDATFRKMIGEIIVKINDPKAVSSLTNVLSDTSDDPYVRAQSASSLADIGGEGVFETLVSNLSNPDEDVRGSCTRALGWLGDKRAGDYLISLVNDSSDYVRKNASGALVLLKDERAFQVLITELSQEIDEGSRHGVIMCLGDLGDPRAIPYLIEHTKPNYDYIIRGSAATSLGKIGGDQAVTALIELLQNSSTVIDAAEALATIGDQRAVEPLIAAIKRTSDSFTLKHLKQAYKTLTGQEYPE